MTTYPRGSAPSSVHSTSNAGYSGETDGYYEIVETPSPAGYISVSANPRFHAKSDLSIELIDQQGNAIQEVADSTVKIEAAASPATLRVGNTLGTPLPLTGGLGTVALPSSAAWRFSWVKHWYLVRVFRLALGVKMKGVQPCMRPMEKENAMTQEPSAMTQEPSAMTQEPNANQPNCENVRTSNPDEKRVRNMQLPVTSLPSMDASQRPYANALAGPTNVQVIAPTQLAPRPRRLRVAGYCRVSTDMAAQRTSIEAQRSHYRQLIEANPAWELVDVYWETGVSGTRAENRPQLQRLMADCRAGRIDMVVTKSISRFSRNTSDCLGLVRELTALGVTLRFEKERLQTDRMQSEFLFTVLAAFAQEESHTISTNMKWGIRKRFAAGTYRPPRAPYGYRKIPRSDTPTDDQGIFIIEPGEANVVRAIFHAVAEGEGPTSVAARLNAAEVLTWSQVNGAGDNAWTDSTVRSIVRNPFYAGAALYQKTFVDDEYRQQQNHGELDRFLSVGMHAAIVDMQTFQAANAQMKGGGEDVSQAVADLLATERMNARAAGGDGLGSFEGDGGFEGEGHGNSVGGNGNHEGDGGCNGDGSFGSDGGNAGKGYGDGNRAGDGRACVGGVGLGCGHSANATEDVTPAKLAVPATHRHKEVQVIKATEVPSSTSSPKPQKLRVCAYCRVSTNSAEQETSYEAQVIHYTNYIQSNPCWALVGIFADEGISGTQARTRPEFNRMIAACDAGEVDLVVTKSISRFARNTLECLNYIRRLKSLKIPIVFEKESINTMEASGELLVTILASIAQQESKSISDNVRMGIQFGFQEGRGRLNCTNSLGYAADGERGGLSIVAGDARLVRRIFRAYLEGYSPGIIAAQLTEEGVRAPAGGQTWYASTVAGMLANEKYCGDLLMQKYFTEDFLTHKVVRNTGQHPQYLVEDAHEPIVPKAVFAQVQGERKRRAALKADPAKLRFGSRDALRGRLVCGKCGRVLKRYAKQGTGACDWRCRPRATTVKAEPCELSGVRCDCRIVDDGEVKRAVVRAFNELPGRRARIERLRRDIMRVQAPALDNAIATLQEILARLKSDPNCASDPAALESLASALEIRRAECASRAVQVRMLLELVDDMQRTAADGPAPAAYISKKVMNLSCDTGGPCHDYETFFLMTRLPAPLGLIGPDGDLTRFHNDFAIRYIKAVTVEDDSYAIHYKAGLTVRVSCERW